VIPATHCSQAVTIALQTHQTQRKIANIIHATDMLKALSSFIHSFIHSHEEGFRILNASPVAAGVGKADLRVCRDEEKSEEKNEGKETK